jgi:lipoprotein-anchoring transpeptidase ErfK/SrfK
MRGSSLKLAVAAILATGLLAACNGSGQAEGSASRSSATATTSSPSVTVPPITGQVTPATSAPVSTSDGSTSTGSSTSTSSSTGSSTASSNTASTAPSTTPIKVVIPPVTVAASPKLGSDDLSPRTPIVIRAAHGTLAGVTLTNSEGNPVKGDLSADKTTWTLGEPLGYDATYQLTGQAVSANGKKVAIKGGYSTTNPDGVINASISPGDGDTVGIAAPILISLGTDIVDTVGRQNIEKAITITAVPKTEGSFAWIHHDDGWGLDWRPKAYWKSGTQVTVTANLYGVSYGNNLWGKEDLTSKFTIGRSEITKGDIHTHRLKVYRDGKLVFDFPTSFGLESDPGRVTRGGTYIVMSKEYLHLMSNPAYHYTNFKAYYAVRISNNGTFIHANDGTADIQGYENETHGCANLTTTNAKLFYDQTMYGDPVEITGSSIPLSESDGDIRDWSISWDKWQTLSALSKSYAG